MSDELLPYYERELSFVRQLGARFALDHPLIATRLGMDPQGMTNDPHVERMIEAFAYLNARTRHKLEDEFPELTESLLSVLYPHYQTPIPSMSIVQFELDPKDSQLTTGQEIAPQSELETDSIEGEPCRFRTCYPVTIWPIALQQASLKKPPFTAPAAANTDAAKALLHLNLCCHDEKLTFAELAIPSLRFFLKGQPQYVYRLYELILNNTMAVALANSPNDPKPVVLSADCVRPVGFERDEGMLPYSSRSFLGYRLLTEYFVFPEKFLFVELAGLTPEMLRGIGNRLHIFFYLNRAASNLEQNVTEMFRLGCTPIVNLYEQPADPIQLTETEYQYRVVPDARRPQAHEIYTIEKVTASNSRGEQIDYRPFFSVKHALPDGAREAFWHATRGPAQTSAGEIDHGTEIQLALVDMGFEASAPADWTLEVKTICLNRDLPHRLQFGGDQPKLHLTKEGGLVSRITCLSKPTRTLRPAQRHQTLWRLISHLSLNHLSLTDLDGKADALREILRLYDFADNPETRKMIDGVVSVHGERVPGRVRGAALGGFCRGVEVTVCFDETKFSGSGLFLLASVLERFLSLYCTVNSFTRMVATVQGHKGVLRRWPARMGEKTVL